VTISSGPTIVALEYDSAWVVILALSIVTLVAVLVFRRLIGRPGGFVSGALLVLPLILPVVAAFLYQQAVLPEISVLRPVGAVLTKESSDLAHLVLVANGRGNGFTLYGLTGTAGPWVVLIGVLASSLMLLRRLVGRIAVGRVIRSSSLPDPDRHPDLQGMVDRISTSAGLKRPPTVLVVDSGSAGAFATGGGRPKIVVSTELLERLDLLEIEAVLAHEIAHVQAHDVPLVALAGFMRDLVVWNPIAHISYRKLTANRELEADRRAAEMIGDPLTVASGLLKVCEMLRGSGLHRRAVLAFQRPGARIRKRVSALIALADGGAIDRRTAYAPYAAALCLAAFLGLQVGARLTQGESSALAIMFGSSTDGERWTARAFDTPELPKEARLRVAAERARYKSVEPTALKPFSQVAISLRKQQLPTWKREMRQLARWRGLETPQVISRVSDDYEAVPLLPDSSSVGLYRMKPLQ
jgi:Zn-dependent protease with chaperone function